MFPIIIFVLRNLAAHYRWSLPKIAQNKQALTQLSSALDSASQELLQLADDATVREELLKGSNTSSYRVPQKRLGTKTTKKGRK